MKKSVSAAKRLAPSHRTRYLKKLVSKIRCCYRRLLHPDLSTPPVLSAIMAKGKQIWQLLVVYHFSCFFFRVNIYFTKKVCIIISFWLDKIFLLNLFIWCVSLFLSQTPNHFSL